MRRIVKFTCHECGGTVEVDMVPEPLALEVVEETDEGVWCKPAGEAVDG